MGQKGALISLHPSTKPVITTPLSTNHKSGAGFVPSRKMKSHNLIISKLHQWGTCFLFLFFFPCPFSMLSTCAQSHLQRLRSWHWWPEIEGTGGRCHSVACSPHRKSSGDRLQEYSKLQDLVFYRLHLLTDSENYSESSKVYLRAGDLQV